MAWKVFAEDAGTGLTDQTDRDFGDGANFTALGHNPNATDFSPSDPSITADFTVPDATFSEAQYRINVSNVSTRDHGSGAITWPETTFPVYAPQTTVALTDSAVNEIFVAIDLTTTGDDGRYVVTTDGSSPTDPSIKVAEIDTSANTVTSFNTRPDGNFSSLDVQGSVTASGTATFGGGGRLETDRDLRIGGTDSSNDHALLHDSSNDRIQLIEDPDNARTVVMEHGQGGAISFPNYQITFGQGAIARSAFKMESYTSLRFGDGNEWSAYYNNSNLLFSGPAGNTLDLADTGNADVPNGQLSEQGNRVATRTWATGNLVDEGGDSMTGTLSVEIPDAGNAITMVDTTTGDDFSWRFSSDGTLLLDINDVSAGTHRYPVEFFPSNGNVDFRNNLNEQGNRVATRTWATSNFVDESGDTMTGNLDLGTNNINTVRDIYSASGDRILLRAQGSAGELGFYDNNSGQWVIRQYNSGDLHLNPFNQIEADSRIHANSGVRVHGSDRHSYNGIDAGTGNNGHLMLDSNGGNLYLNWDEAGGDIRAQGNKLRVDSWLDMNGNRIDNPIRVGFANAEHSNLINASLGWDSSEGGGGSNGGFIYQDDSGVNQHLVNSSSGDYDVQKNGTDGTGVINFKT